MRTEFVGFVTGASYDGDMIRRETNVCLCYYNYYSADTIDAATSSNNNATTNTTTTTTTTKTTPTTNDNNNNTY